MYSFSHGGESYDLTNMTDISRQRQFLTTIWSWGNV